MRTFRLNNRVEANRRRVFPLRPWRDFESSFCAPPFISAAVAHSKRYMKNARFGLSSTVCAILLAYMAPRTGLTQQKQAFVRDYLAAPTGTYAAYTMPLADPFALDPFPRTNRVLLFTLRLETNGTYFSESTERRPVQDGDLVKLMPDVARGNWRWQAEKREFELEPGTFTLYIKRLPVDKANPNRLVWGRHFLERQDSK